MTEIFTQEDLVRHLYTEDTPEEAEMMENSLAVNEALTESFQNFVNIKEALNQILIEPSQITVENILNYSVSTRK
ncbi:hypothetical protein [Solitalea koreensis]|uniref:Uncharacterized protein n=1 Tax=Solitalea koreensis TaxID=543615 RepID=A0A521ELM3_9SPHI|nr:hypothetical protein [Solitalea koreensis]SMO84802.1 hypothetical protein SAMN06265350_11712 [Solitalea koreensis]